METVRVKQKGQVTLPVEARRKLDISEGDLLDIEAREDGTIILKAKKLIEPGPLVSPAKRKKIMDDLRKTRENWR